METQWKSDVFKEYIRPDAYRCIKPRGKNFQVRITHRGTNHYIGTFHDLQTAMKHRDNAMKGMQ